jgi:hypothetical protein
MTRSVGGCIPTRAVGTIIGRRAFTIQMMPTPDPALDALARELIVPTLRVVTPLQTLCVQPLRLRPASGHLTRSVGGCIPTRSVGTIIGRRVSRFGSYQCGIPCRSALAREDGIPDAQMRRMY